MDGVDSVDREESRSSRSSSSSATSESETTSDDDSSFSDDSDSPAAIAKRLGPPNTDKIPPCGPLQTNRPLTLEEFERPSLRQRHLLENYAEAAYIHQYSAETSAWVRRNAKVVICPVPFARGAMRSSYYCIDMDNFELLCVAKRYRKSSVKEEQYRADVLMHSVAQRYADMFNGYSPPKPVNFNPAWVLELVGRWEPVVLACEPYMFGEFVKHNNNNGYVSDAQRCTPHAFSHFTYHYSSGNLLVCDIQGVEDTYTDPQIHTQDGEEYGRGNLGLEGMQRFLQTHICSAVCRELRLPCLRGPSEASSGPAATAEMQFSTPPKPVDSSLWNRLWSKKSDSKGSPANRSGPVTMHNQVDLRPGTPPRDAAVQDTGKLPIGATTVALKPASPAHDDFWKLPVKTTAQQDLPPPTLDDL